jgi:hypothetical protein
MSAAGVAGAALIRNSPSVHRGGTTPRAPYLLFGRAPRGRGEALAKPLEEASNIFLFRFRVVFCSHPGVPFDGSVVHLVTQPLQRRYASP